MLLEKQTFSQPSKLNGRVILVQWLIGNRTKSSEFLYTFDILSGNGQNAHIIHMAFNVCHRCLPK